MNIKTPWYFTNSFGAVQFSSVAQSCLTFCDPVNRSTPGLPVHHQLLYFCFFFCITKCGGFVTKSCLTLVTPWTVARQAPLSFGFSRQEYLSGLPFSSPGDLPNPGTEPGSLALQADSLPTELPGNSK